MNKTPLSNRMHIGIFGRRNAGKSTLINAITGQEIAIVSEIPGTTTDPVYKAMEIHDIGPVVMIDTGGIDDDGPIGRMRVEKAYKILNKTDVALLVVDRAMGFGDHEEYLLTEMKTRRIPFIIVINKEDIAAPLGDLEDICRNKKYTYVKVSALNKTGIPELRKKIVDLCPDDFERKMILKDILEPSDVVVLVAPLDIEAPKGRLKLPQVQTIRDILDSDCTTIVLKENELEGMLANLKARPKLVIAESQVFAKVNAMLPADILLTSFSALYARYKGDLETLAEGVKSVESLKPGDKVLIAEACTHHPIGDDIGRVVIPNLLNARFEAAGKKLNIDYCAGYDFPQNVKDYKLVIHCGGCMLNRREMIYRINTAKNAGVPITNYGLVIAYASGILDRIVRPFGINAEMKFLDMPV